MRQVLSFVVAVALIVSFCGCAGNPKFQSVTDLEPTIHVAITSFGQSVRQEKVDLQAMTCGSYPTDFADPVLAGKPMDCYVRLIGIADAMAGYDTTLQNALIALNTTDAKTAVSGMIGVIRDFVQNQLPMVPKNIKTWVSFGLTTVQTALATIQASMGV